MGVQTAVMNKDSIESLLPLLAEQQRYCGREIDPSRTRAFLEDFVGSETCFLVVASRHEAAVGFVMVDTQQSTQRAARAAYMHDAYVTESDRVMGGVGIRLISTAFDEAARRGYEFVEGETDTDNVNAQRLYEGMAKRLGIEYVREVSVRYRGDMRSLVERVRAEAS
ncbi:GNAT family N-acetyltransferase [Actinomadura roseirufa]|uniref:GNAT family N-acetyltransferase n=1 Tax=Actinomadura roseirufa TaxID=2094049 RepID=UPI0010411B69|nr:GNAT family N-acetyltransferase [Actinomadura roseirufa]